MRFTEDGPSIPDELLIARDQGRVIFFCGAGVSFTKAKLPNFIQLAEMVINKLGVVSESPIRKVLEEINKIENRTSVSGLISVDRIFGLLEKEFDVKDIELEVASILKTENADLSAHQIMIDLSTNEEGITRLVTTNFDRLFNDCDKKLKSWIPPRLPDLSNSNEMNGIVYLHGKANSEYNGAEGDGFVLSSSEFGRAYLSEGWATSFIKEIINNYYLVFIGYSADDPPVNYLLEALDKNKNDYKNMYAFQSGNIKDASDKWEHKGVKSIPFENGYSSLWETLKKWASRARDVDAWYSDIILNAKGGPKNLLPFERGQIAHIVSTVYGIKKIIDCNEFSAEWLCVFDSSRRYAKPGYKGNLNKKEVYVDPFNEYGIDIDIPPSKIDHDDFITKREIPENTWNAFDINEFDRRNVEDKDLASIINISMSLPVRLSYIGVWIRNISNQSAAIWWAAHQNNLHPHIKNRILWAIYAKESERDIRRLWNYLFETWEHNKDYNHEWYEIEREIKKDGWSNNIVRKYEVNTCPYIKVRNNGPIAPDCIEELNNSLFFNVKYPENNYDIKIPDRWVYEIVRVLRRNLELAKQLETEIGQEYKLSDISPLYRDNHSEYFDLSRAVEEFSILYERLITIDISKAKQELSIWNNDDNIFCRLKIWAAGKKEIIDGKGFSEIIDCISDKAFWNYYHQRDLLLTIRNRWVDINLRTRRKIEKRILKGPPKWNNEEKFHYEERKAGSILDRINWLSENACELSIELKKENERLLEKTIEWKTEYANHAADSHEGVSGWVQMDTEYSELLTCPIEKLIEKAKELNEELDDILIRKNPFGGLAYKEPEVALKALKAAKEKNFFSDWAWRIFLRTDYRNNDSSEFSVSIAELIISLSTDEIRHFIMYIMYWFQLANNSILEKREKCFDRLSEKLLNFMIEFPEECKTTLVRKREHDWIDRAINSPTGIFAQVVFNDHRKDDLDDRNVNSSDWLKIVEKLLILPDEIKKYSVVILSSNLIWFYSKIPEWTEKFLLTILESEDKEIKDAFMEGVLWGVKIPFHKLYLRLKPYYIETLKKNDIKKRKFIDNLAAIILSGWISENDGVKMVSDEELRELLISTDDVFRSRIIWQFIKWIRSEDSSKLLTLKAFFDDVWPRQKLIKSPKISDSLCRLILTDNIIFDELFEKVICLLTELDSNSGLFNLNNEITDLFPERVLTLLYKVLPFDTIKWPYNSGEIFLSIGNADPSLKKDQRFIELKRKWNSQ